MNKKSIFLAVLASAMLAACSNDSERNGRADDRLLRLSTGSIDVATRTASMDLLKEQFDNGDEIDIFLTDANDKETAEGAVTYTQPMVYTADGSGNLTYPTPVYWPPYFRNLYGWGVYPKGKAGTDADATGVEFSVQQDQSTDAAYKASDLMTGVATTNPWVQTDNLTGNTITLQFTHLLSKVKVNLSKTAATTDITDAMLATAQIYIMSTLPTTKFAPKSTVVNKTDASGTAFTGGIYVCEGTEGSCIVVPQDMTAGDDFIKVVVGGDTFVYKVPAGGYSFEPQKQHVLNIQIHKANIILTSSITAWDTTTPDTNGTAILQ